MDNMSTQGLLERSNGYYFQAPIPKKYLPHYPKSHLVEKLPTDNRKEAIALVRKRWAELHLDFERIDSTNSKLKTTISPADADYLIKQAIHSRLSADDESRSLGLDDFSYQLSQNNIDEAEATERLAVSRGQLTSHARAVVSDWLSSYGYQISPESNEFREFALRFIKAQTTATTVVNSRQQGIPIETPTAPAKEPSVSSELDTLEKLRDYWLTQPSETTAVKKEELLRVMPIQSLTSFVSISET